ncbi:MAG: rRNA methyltransferase [Candidatus Nanogingivalaceae bacterium]|jgi:tRNA/rRNA methyltransferase|nr:rRNA methyltransferase [Candidatus Nanogingivalaceae bacterium]
MENRPNFETGEGLTVQNDTRNVIDKYKGLSVAEIKDDLDRSRHDFHVAIENFQHDFNIGTIARNANAFNAAGIHIIGRRHWNRRGAMKTEAYMNIFHHETGMEFIDWAKQNNLKLIAIDNQKGSKKLNEIELEKGSILVFGNESDGLSKEMVEACKEMVAIEQFGSTRSVNVGVASGILMYEFVRQNYLTK